MFRGLGVIGFRCLGVSGFRVTGKSDALERRFYTIRVQVPNNHILTQNVYYKHYYPTPKYLIIGHMGP